MKTAVSSDKNPHIVLFNMTLSGGAGKFIVTLAKALVKAGARVDIVIYKNAIDYEIPENVEFHLLLNGEAWKESWRIEKALRETLKKLDPFDLVLSNSTPSNKILSRLGLPNAYHVVHSAETKSYSGPMAPLKRWWRRRTYRKLYTGKHLITVSKGLKKYIVNDLKAQPLSIQTIYNPFDFDEILQKSQEPIEGIPKEPYIINVARFSLVQKRQDVLLQAYKKADIPQKLVLLGAGDDEKKIHFLIKELDLENRVLLPGFSKNPYAWIKHADLFVLSSDFEGFGRVLAESLAVGTPVVSTHCPYGPDEILKEDLSLFLSPPGDVNALSKNIKKALYKYSRFDRETLQEFEEENVVKKILEISGSMHHDL